VLSGAEGLDDLELMRRAQSGDVDAFAHIYDRHAPVLLAVAQRMLASASEAHDLLHDVFLEAWQAVRSYDPQRAGVRTWLLVRTRSRALDRMGQRARQQSAQRALALAGTADATLGMASEHTVAVRAALAVLEPGVRTTLELTYYAGMTALEIAERMRVPEGTVRSRLARGLQQLETALRDLKGSET
jgi:RNA polymerase sigma-70 factor (ECF subfamily)